MKVLKFSKNNIAVFFMLFNWRNTILGNQLIASITLERSASTRTVYPEVPPRVEYSLTDLGMSLQPVLHSLQSWGESYKASF